MGLGLIGVATVSATAGALLAFTMSSKPLMQRKMTTADAAVFRQGDRILSLNRLQLPEITRPVNVLVLGAKVLTDDTDNIPPELKNLRYKALVNSFEGLTDTMLLIRFNPADKKLTVLSIPRDTRVEVPGYGIGKINSANALGGPALSARATSELLGGVGVDRYVTINVQGVEALIDALGGVTVYVPKDMKYQDDSQHLYINLKAGRQHLSGSKALQLLRFRNDEQGDIGRVQRQQMVMRALSEQALNPATLARLPKILSVIQTHLDTNLSIEELVALVAFASGLKRSDMQMLITPGSYGDIAQYGTSYWLPDADRIQTLVARHFNLGSLPASEITKQSLRLSIQDSARRTRNSRRLINKLEQAGYTNVEIDRPHSEPLRTTRILAQQGDQEAATLIQQTLGIGEVRIDATGNLESDITIQIGSDWQ